MVARPQAIPVQSIPMLASALVCAARDLSSHPLGPTAKTRVCLNPCAHCVSSCVPISAKVYWIGKAAPVPCPSRRPPQRNAGMVRGVRFRMVNVPPHTFVRASQN